MHENKLDIHLVEVRVARNGVVRIEGRSFMYRSEAGEGYWCRARLPDPPQWVRDTLAEMERKEAEDAREETG